MKRAWDRAREGDADDDDAFLDDAEDMDTEYLPAPEFSIDMRYSTGGSFDLVRVVTAPNERKPSAWETIRAPAGRGNTAAQFGGVSADNYARQIGNVPAGPYEWCHILGDALGGPTSAANLFCGTYHANTAMLCVEKVLRGKTELEVLVEVDVRQGTHFGERIVYRIRKKHGTDGRVKRQGSEFSATIDAQATGCTKQDGEELSGRVRAWLGPAASIRSFV